MKKLVILLVTILFPVLAWAGQEFTTAFDASVYESPNPGSRLLTTLPAGSTATVVALDRDNYWARVSLPKGRIGYVDLGSLDFPGGKTVTVTDTFDANKIGASKGGTSSNILETILGILFILILAGGLAHMFHVRANVDNEARIFVGSLARIVLFALLMLAGVFTVDGFWAKLFQAFGALLTVAFSYYAYLRPQSKLLVDGSPTKNALQILGGMWTDLENQQVDKARVHLLDKKIKNLQDQRNSLGSQLSEEEKQRLSQEISSLQSEKSEEETKMNQTVAMTFVSIIVAILFVWLTPFVAVIQYVRNYPLYLRKRDKYQQKAAISTYSQA